MAGQLAGTTVLLADDDPDNLELIAYIFLDAGASVRTASSAQAVLSVLSDWKPAVLLLDISMPQMDGYALLGEIRQDPSLRDVPAIAVTGSAYQRDKHRAAAAGFAAHVSKPFDGESLLHLVMNLTTPRPAADESPEEAAFLHMLEHDGLHTALGFLNARCAHRFTGVYRFDGPLLRSVDLFDRLDPARPRGDDAPLVETYCSIVGDQRQAFVTTDTEADSRLTEHPARLNVRSYCGELLRNADATPFGSLCAFDLEARPVTNEFLALLHRIAPVVATKVAHQD
jgi:CheY-like chemotaxis protein